MPEKRIVLKNCHSIDPKDLSSYLNEDGFKALARARNEMTPQKVIEEVKASGLRGRGGAGFPCGLKWELARKSQGDEKFVICNADEGEPGTFKDRYILEHDPFTLIESLAIASYAIGTDKAFIYLRAEYHFLIDLLERAITQAKEGGFLEDLDIQICEGAGSYVCGEESALMNSIEGRRGEARYRPPFPPSKGLWGKPTVINNVETLMNIPQIILKGADWFNTIGTEESKGTKVFSISGDVEKPGIYELVMGSPLKELLDMAGAAQVKMVQIGGASGHIIPRSEIERPLSYEGVLGSGAVTVFDESRDVIDIVHKDLAFMAEESCGKCAPCREGTEAMVGIFERLSRGEAFPEDITALEDLSQAMMASSLCGLGQTAPVPVLDTLKYFRNDYELRIKQSEVLRSLRGIAK
ncbi:MAG: NADP oxidoreductase [Deltaproteobacteria bacterium]|nr:MAG: NADP oxidoreductase [Deltaproteobacteria bacterium]